MIHLGLRIRRHGKYFEVNKNRFVVAYPQPAIEPDAWEVREAGNFARQMISEDLQRPQDSIEVIMVAV